MAEAILSAVLDHLQQLVVREGELLSGVEEKIGWMTTEFQLMVPVQESVEAQHQLTENEEKCVNKTRELIRRADDVIDTYAKKASMSKMGALYKKPIYWTQKRGLSKEMDTLRDEIIQLRQAWGGVDFDKSLRSSSSLESSSLASPAMAKLDALVDQDDAPLIMKWVRDELAPLHLFLQEISSVKLGERQKIWIQGLRDIFNFVDRSWSSKIPEAVWSEIQNKILQLYRIYYTYGFGEIRVNKSDGSTSFIYPRIRMAPPPSHAITYLSLLMPMGPILETLELDLKLINALVEDIRAMGQVDERVKVWLRHVQEASVDIEELIAAGKTNVQIRETMTDRCGDMIELISREFDISQTRITSDPPEVLIMRCEIRDIAVRRMTYSIGRAMGEGDVVMPVDHPVLADRTFFEEPYIPKYEIRRRVKAITKDLELMQFVLEDVSSTDERLCVWMEGMRYVARQANALLADELHTSTTNKTEEARINRIYNHILVLSRWKHTYGIPDIISRARPTIRQSRRDEPMDMDYEEELMRTEQRLIRTFNTDAKKMGELDRTSQVWAEEMRKIAEDDIKFDPYYGQSRISIIAEFLCRFFCYGAPKNALISNYAKDKIGHLSQLRIAYGIELAQRLRPEVVQQIKSTLLMDHKQTQPCILPVLEMRNAHKEALQDLIGAMRQHFDWHAWIYVPIDITPGSILEYLTEQITEQEKARFLKEEEPTSSSLLVLEMLMRKKGLIVLDEIHDTQVWTFLIQALQQVSTGSRVVVISTEDSYSLLDSASSAMCHTPPRLIHPNSGMDDDLSSTTVPSYLSQCLYYFLLFPADFNVPVRRLVVLLVIEGLVHSKENENKSAENVAEDYLEQLIGQGLVRVTDRKLNGKPKSCRLKDGERRKLLETAKQTGFFKDVNGIISRLVDHHDITDNSCFIKIHGNPKSSQSVPTIKTKLSPSCLSIPRMEASQERTSELSFANAS